MLHKQVSFIIDSKGNKRAAVVPIEIYNELMTLQKALSDNRPGERELYHFNGKGAEAHGYPVGKRQNPGFMVLAGSTANGEDAASLREAVIELRLELLNKGILVPRSQGGFVFTADQLFNSPVWWRAITAAVWMPGKTAQAIPSSSRVSARSNPASRQHIN